jgi:hypothetical protein
MVFIATESGVLIFRRAVENSDFQAGGGELVVVASYIEFDDLELTIVGDDSVENPTHQSRVDQVTFSDDSFLDRRHTVVIGG